MTRSAVLWVEAAAVVTKLPHYHLCNDRTYQITPPPIFPMIVPGSVDTSLGSAKRTPVCSYYVLGRLESRFELFFGSPG